VASADEPTGTTLFPGSGAEQDPVQWWQNAKKAATAVISQAGVPPQKIAAVACDSQWSVVVPVAKNADPLMGAVHWLDTRGGKYNRQVAGGLPSIQG